MFSIFCLFFFSSFVFIESFTHLLRFPMVTSFLSPWWVFLCRYLREVHMEVGPRWCLKWAEIFFWIWVLDMSFDRFSFSTVMENSSYRAFHFASLFSPPTTWVDPFVELSLSVLFNLASFTFTINTGAREATIVCTLYPSVTSERFWSCSACS